MREILANHPPEIPDSVPKPLKDLLKSCWGEPDLRPTFADIVKIAEADDFLPAEVLDVGVCARVSCDDTEIMQVSHDNCVLCQKLKQRPDLMR